MGMIGCFKTASNRDFAALLEKPKRIEKFLYEDEFEEEPPQKKSFFSILKKDSWVPESKDEEMDVDKAWQGIHFLLTGSSYEGSGPLAFVLYGGKTIGNVDVGYGPARGFNSTEVKDISNALAKINMEDLKAKCDQEIFKKNDIYPSIWDEDFDSCFGYILSYFEDLKQYVSQAANDNKSLIVYLC